jgi:hypothetical protein
VCDVKIYKDSKCLFLMALQFEEEELRLGETFPSSREYMPQDSMFSYGTARNIHHGQIKLMLSEIEFLTQIHVSRHIKGIDGTYPPLPRLVCVYIGACPCQHLDKILKMFPNVSWILVDPRFGNAKFRWTQSHWDKKQVVVYPKLFDDSTAQAISEWSSGRKPNHVILPLLQGLDADQNDVGFENLLFISDIRSDAFDEHSIAMDMEYQSKWFKSLYASAGLLKFRLPYCNAKWYAEYQKHGGVYKYLDGIIFLPIWGCKSTSECRLHVKRGCGMKDYDVKKHEMRMAGFDANDRDKDYVFADHIYSSFDAAAEEFTMQTYLECMKQYGYTVSI